MWGRIKEYFRRIAVELAVLAFLGLILFVFKFSDAKPLGEALLFYKIILFSASQVHALATRKLLYPYINFKEETDTVRKIMIVAIHVSAAYLYAEGG